MQFERKRNIKKINDKSDALLKLEKYKGLMGLEISLSDREYIEKIIKGIEYNQFSQPKIKEIEKAFKNNKDIGILEAIKRRLCFVKRGCAFDERWFEHSINFKWRSILGIR